VIGTDGSPDGAYGVYGYTRVGTAVYGVATSGGYGVYGSSTISTAVYGDSAAGIGVLAQSTEGSALVANGPAVFNAAVQFRTSGIAKVKKGSASVTVKVAGMSKSNIVLATIQEPQAGLAVEGAKPANGSFTITLSGKAKATVPVGWFVLG
jgi:hypothetical protein